MEHRAIHGIAQGGTLLAVEADTASQNSPVLSTPKGLQALVLSICRRPATWNEFMQMGRDLLASVLQELTGCPRTAALVFDIVRSLQVPRTLGCQSKC